MSVKKVIVEIDCEKECCGPCHGLSAVDLYGHGKMDSPACNIFNEDLAQHGELLEDGMPNAYRCAKCKAAEEA